MIPIEEPLFVDVEKKRPSLVRKILYGLSWIIIWPITIGLPVYMAIPALLSEIASLLSNNYELNKTVAADKIFYLELFIFFSATVFVGFLLLIKLLLSTRRRLFFRTGAKLLGFYIWVSLIATGFAMAYLTKTPETFQPNPSGNQSVVSILQSVGAKSDLLEGVLSYYVDGYNEENRFGEYMHVQSADGTFLYGTITIKQSTDPKQLKTVVAHEYLHHIWYVHLDEPTLGNLTSQLTTLYDKDAWMQHRVNEFPDGNYQLPTELFSLYCTEVPDKYLNQFVLETCNAYIDRSALTFTRI